MDTLPSRRRFVVLSSGWLEMVGDVLCQIGRSWRPGGGRHRQMFVTRWLLGGREQKSITSTINTGGDLFSQTFTVRALILFAFTPPRKHLAVVFWAARHPSRFPELGSWIWNMLHIISHVRLSRSGGLLSHILAHGFALVSYCRRRHRR